MTKHKSGELRCPATALILILLKLPGFESQLYKANTTDTEAPFLDLHLPIANGFDSSKIYDNAMTLILI